MNINYYLNLLFCYQNGVIPVVFFAALWIWAFWKDNYQTQKKAIQEGSGNHFNF